MTERRALDFTTDDGIRLVGDSRGPQNGPLVLLLHGGGQTRHAWTSTANRLAGEGYHVVTYDARGHGDSGWSPDGDYALPRHGRDLLGVLHTLGTPAMLVGASMGGTSSLITASDEPDVARALILVDIVPGFAPDGVERIRSFMTAKPEGFADLDEAAAAVSAYNPNRKAGNPAGLMRNLREGPDGRLRWHWDPRVIGETPTAETSQMLAERLHSLPESLPILLVAGANSDVVDEAALETFRAQAPHAEVISVAKAGHMVAGDRNDAFGDAISGFLGRARDQALVSISSSRT
jgi:pimeloyl-ACP methyl ester carboxylesterase